MFSCPRNYGIQYVHIRTTTRSQWYLQACTSGSWRHFFSNLKACHKQYEVIFYYIWKILRIKLCIQWFRYYLFLIYYIEESMLIIARDIKNKKNLEYGWRTLPSLLRCFPVLTLKLSHIGNPSQSWAKWVISNRCTLLVGVVTNIIVTMSQTEKSTTLHTSVSRLKSEYICMTWHSTLL